MTLIFFQKICLLNENSTPLNVFSCSLLLAFPSGLICHTESAFLSVPETYTKWVGETPGFFWHPGPEEWVSWPHAAAKKPGPTHQLCSRGVGPPPHKATHRCMPPGLTVASTVHQTLLVSSQTLPLGNHVTDFAQDTCKKVVMSLLGKNFKSQSPPVSQIIFLLLQYCRGTCQNRASASLAPNVQMCQLTLRWVF